MTRDEIVNKIFTIFKEEFEIIDSGVDDDLREVHEFDSIDAIELLIEIEYFLDTELTQDEKKAAMDIRTINDICDYIKTLADKRGV